MEGEGIDDSRLAKHGKLLKQSDGYTDVHYIIFSTFVYLNIYTQQRVKRNIQGGPKQKGVMKDINNPKGI